MSCRIITYMTLVAVVELFLRSEVFKIRRCFSFQKLMVERRWPKNQFQIECTSRLHLYACNMYNIYVNRGKNVTDDGVLYPPTS